MNRYSCNIVIQLQSNQMCSYSSLLPHNRHYQNVCLYLMNNDDHKATRQKCTKYTSIRLCNVLPPHVSPLSPVAAWPGSRRKTTLRMTELRIGVKEKKPNRYRNAPMNSVSDAHSRYYYIWLLLWRLPLIPGRAVVDRVFYHNILLLLLLSYTVHMV